MNSLFVCILLLFYPNYTVSVANLKYFETLSHVAVTSITKRSADGPQGQLKQVKFTAFDRNFDLTLQSGTNLMAKGFRASLVHENGSLSTIELDESLIFSGYLTNEPDVKVHAHIEDTLWSIQIFYYKDIYVVEPAWRLLTQTDNPRNDTMIAYRASDLTFDTNNSSTFCGVHDHTSSKKHLPRAGRRRQPQVVASRSSSPHKKGEWRRQERSEDRLVVCDLYLVGDYTFFKGRCKANQQACLALMFANVQQADAIYTKSVFLDANFQSIQRLGLEIAEIVLYSSYSTPAKDVIPTHFNENREWTVGAKLDAFAEYNSYVTNQRPTCLSHLLTDYPFPGRVLGLAWMMTACLESIPGTLKKNVGLTSGTESTQGPISTMQMTLVFVHGHNFGSEHDPASSECSAPDSEGGNFIMFPRAVTGKYPNNAKFSVCSLRHIGSFISQVRCLASRSRSSYFCGDGIVGINEECDAGAYGVIDTDLCCSSSCKLRNSGTCSDINQACCSNCTMVSQGTMCLPKDSIECEKASYCTGNSYDCPTPLYLEDWTSCKDRGQCYRGICRSFCETISIKLGINLQGCLCQTNEDGAACKWCCYDVSDIEHPGPCEVYSNDTVNDGRPCFIGYCKNGICETDDTSTIQRFYHYLPALETSQLGNFFKSNIVASVLILSIIMWLPVVIYVRKIDKHMEREEPRLTIIFETEKHRHRTAEEKARRQRRKKRRLEKEAIMLHQFQARLTEPSLFSTEPGLKEKSQFRMQENQTAQEMQSKQNENFQEAV